MIAVGIPVYKARETLPAALDSLVSQTKKMFVVYLSIDGDNENYDDIVNEYRNRGLKIIVINSKENSGPGMARQKIIDAAERCNYIMFLDSDDILMPRAVEMLGREANINNADLVSSNIVVESSHEPGGIMEVDKTCLTWCHGKIYRRDFLIKNNIRFNPNFRANEDSYFNLIVGHLAKRHFAIHENTYYWRDNKNSITRKELPPSERFEKVHKSYGYTQVAAMKEIFNRLNDMSDHGFCGTIINIYKYVNIQRFYKDDLEEFKTYCQSLKKIKPLQDKFNNINIWKEFIRECPSGEEIDDNIFFYKYSFMDFLKDYILEDKTIIKEEYNDSNN